MLKLSTKGRYGLRAMVELSHAYGKGAVFMADIAERQGLTRKYLHALLTSLKKANLVESVRGARGGYLLARPPHLIRVSEVVEALEGSLAVVGCLETDNVCARYEGCSTRAVWKNVNDAIASVLSGTTLADLI